MSRLFSEARIVPKVTIELEEHEFRALLYLSEFGADTVIEKLAPLSDNVKSKHRDGLWQFLDQFHQNGGGIRDAIDRARSEFHSGKRKS